MPLPEFSPEGDLPSGLYGATLEEVLARFATGTQKRIYLGGRLATIYNSIKDTGYLARFIIFGSFVTSKPLPNDVDIFTIVEVGFDISNIRGETTMLMTEHLVTQDQFDASVFWMSSGSAMGGNDYWIGTWGIKRDGGYRGIVEIVSE